MFLLLFSSFRGKNPSFLHRTFLTTCLGRPIPPTLSSPTSASLSVGMICLALDEIVSDGVVEATDWDTIRRGIKLKMSGD